MIPNMVGLPRAERRELIMGLERDNKQWPGHLVLVKATLPTGCTAAWRSRDFMVQEYPARGGVIRLSVNRTHVDPQTYRWVDGITWDELQSLKAQAGYGDREAVEVFPPEGKVVDVANIRHLWVLPQRMEFSW